MWRRAASRALALRAPLSRRISGDALSRKAIATPATVARVSERQFLRDGEEMAIAMRRKALLDERRALAEAEKARLEALEAPREPAPGPLVTEDTLRNVLVVAAALATGTAMMHS